MKLKPIIVSMMLLGLTAPAFADDSNLSPAAQSQLDAMKAQLDKMEAIVNQNATGGYAQYNDWYKRITLSGMVNVDFQQANTTPNFAINPSFVNRTTGNARAVGNGNTNNLALNNANILIDALASDWTKVHIGLVYDHNRSTAFDREPSYDTLDEAYVTLGNFSEYPVYLRAGKEYVPFGVYQRYPMLKNPTQLLSQTQETAAQIGFVTRMGFYGSAYTFRGIDKNRADGEITPSITSETRPRMENYGVDLGYAYTSPSNFWSTKVDVGYLDNMADVRYIANAIDKQGGYLDRAHGLSASGDLTVGPFDFGVLYVTALESFNASNIADASSLQVNNNGTVSVDGAKPAALGVDLGFSFPVLAHQTRVGVGYQHTWDAASNISYGVDSDTGNQILNGAGAFGLPLDRYYADYVVNISKWTDVGLEVYRDRDYSLNNGGTGLSSTGGVLRLGVKFA